MCVAIIEDIVVSPIVQPRVYECPGRDTALGTAALWLADSSGYVIAPRTVSWQPSSKWSLFSEVMSRDVRDRPELVRHTRKARIAICPEALRLRSAASPRVGVSALCDGSCWTIRKSHPRRLRHAVGRWRRPDEDAPSRDDYEAASSSRGKWTEVHDKYIFYCKIYMVYS